MVDAKVITAPQGLSAQNIMTNVKCLVPYDTFIDPILISQITGLKLFLKPYHAPLHYYCAIQHVQYKSTTSLMHTLCLFSVELILFVVLGLISVCEKYVNMATRAPLTRSPGHWS